MTVKKTIRWDYTKPDAPETVYEGPAPRNYTTARPRAVPAHPCLEDTQTIRGALARAAEPPTDGTADDSAALTCA